MKIGILTLFNAHNYGAVLQAYALKIYLESLDNHVVIINYRNPNIERAYPEKIGLRFGKKDILFPWRWKNLMIEVERGLYSQKDWRIQYQKFEKFIEKFLGVDNVSDWRDQVKDQNIIFFGSDQIWEKNIVGSENEMYLGGFETKAKKVSYAASCFSEESSIDEDMVKSLKDFYMLSTRERRLAEILQNKIGREKKIFEVVDPVFLLNTSDYQKLFVPINIFKPYCLFYFVSENDELRKISDYLRKKDSRKIIEIHYYKTRTIIKDWQMADVGPREFLTLIANADEVYTNSFHGTAFSIIFHKQFWSLSKNMRITNLLKKFELEYRRISNQNEWMCKRNNICNFEKADFIMADFVNDSKAYILKALELSKKGV